MDLRTCIKRLDTMISSIESDNEKYSDSIRKLAYEEQDVSEESIMVLRNRIRRNKSDISSLKLAKKMVLKEKLKEL